MKSTIYGSGANSIVTLYRIHQGGCYFKKDTSTEHSQIKRIQTYLNNNGYNCGTADGKYGDNTMNGVKAFQRANHIQVDGLFGQGSLEALESALGGTHLDTNCLNSGDKGAYGCYDKVDQSSPNYPSLRKKYNKSSGPNLTSMTDAWNYWGWSKYIKVR